MYPDPATDHDQMQPSGDDDASANEYSTPPAP